SATLGWRQSRTEAIAASIASPYFFADFELFLVFSNSAMSAPAANALSPAPRSTTQRSVLSRSSSRMTSPTRFHIPRSRALSVPGLLSVMVAMSPSRPERIAPGMLALRERAQPAERCGDDRPEEQHQRERRDRADQAVRPEHAQVAARADHRQAERVLGAGAEHGREGDRDLLEYVTDDAEDQHQPDVEHRVLDRVRADRARHHDHRRDRGKGHAQHRGEERHGREHHNEADDVAEVHRGDQAPDEVL